MAKFTDFSVQKSVSPTASTRATASGDASAWTGATIEESRAIYIGADEDYKFYINGAWVTFQGCKAGSVLPIRATGARDEGDDSVPADNAIIFLY